MHMRFAFAAYRLTVGCLEFYVMSCGAACQRGLPQMQVSTPAPPNIALRHLLVHRLFFKDEVNKWTLVFLVMFFSLKVWLS